MSVDKRADNVINKSLLPNPGPYLARIVNNVDPLKQGALEVELLRPIGNQKEMDQQLFVVRYLSPFYGVTSIDHTSADPVDFNNTQKSYGFWAVPPDVGVTVMVIFVDSDPGQGYWIGCVQDALMNHMIPGIAASEYTQDQVRDNDDTSWKSVQSTQSKYSTTFLPVGEVNRKPFKEGNAKPDPNVEANKKPIHPIAEYILKQGLINDRFRGLHTSSARRESPSNVYGWSTPGPVDKRQNAIKGKVGRLKGKIDKFVSRMGGHCIIMDDGDERFLRKTRPWEGPPEYADLEKGETGLVDYPKDESFRIRTRKGAQILMHVAEDFIYICNSRGTAWMEMTSNGKIEFYAQEGVHMGSGADIQMTAARHVATQANGNHVTNVLGDTIIQSGGDHSFTAGGSAFHHADSDHSINAGNYCYSSGAAGQHIRGESLNFNGKAYEWTVGGNLMLTVQGNFEVRAVNTLISSDFQTHMVSGNNTRIFAQDIHMIAGNDLMVDSYGRICLHSDQKMILQSGDEGSWKSGKALKFQSDEDGSWKSKKGLKFQAEEGIDLKAGKDIKITTDGALGVTAKGEIKAKGDKIHLNGPNPDKAGDAAEAPESPYPAKEALEAEQATGGASHAVAGGGYSTRRESPITVSEGFGTGVCKRVPTGNGIFTPENTDPEGTHVTLTDPFNPRTTRKGGSGGQQYTIRTPGDVPRVPNTHGGTSEGNVPTTTYAPHETYKTAAPPLDPDYANKHPKNWTKDKEFLQKAEQLAKKYGTDLEGILSVFACETGYEMSPSNTNRWGYTGLIQFGEAAAHDVGTTTGALRQMSRVQQLEYVDKYLGRYNPQGADQIYISIAYPKAMKYADNQVIFAPGTKGWHNNPAWRSGGRGSSGPVTKSGIKGYLDSQRSKIRQYLKSAGITTGSSTTSGTTDAPLGVSVNPNSSIPGGSNPR